jgi:hypothetical protein
MREGKSLKEVLESFASRKAEEEAASKKQLADQRASSEHAVKVLGKVVIPTLERVAETLKAVGHECDVHKPQATTSPRAGLAFRPVVAGRVRGLDSQLFFTVTEENTITAKRDIRAPGDGPPGLSGGMISRQFVLDSSSAEVVEFEAAEFVQDVLSRY